VAALDRHALEGHWVHSHEEDGEDELVFRRATHPFPPSRGRTSFELRPDGSYVERSPGPVDVPEESTGDWSLDRGRVVLRPAAGRPERTLEVKAAEPDRLAFRRPR
jgi:hypothetical protein